MFSVEFLHQKSQAYVPILNGVTFGFLDKPLFFRIQAEGAPTAFEMEFVVSRSSEKKPLQFDIERRAGDSGRFVLWNPTEGGASGLKQPIGFIHLPPNHVLGFVCIVDMLRDTEMYRLTYEFSKGLIEAPKQGGAQ